MTPHAVAGSPPTASRVVTTTRFIRVRRPARPVSPPRTRLTRIKPLDLYPGAGGPEVAQRRAVDIARASPGLVDVAADGQPRPLFLDRVQQRRAAEVHVLAGTWIEI